MNIKITSGELNNWGHDGESNEFPTSYLLEVKFHDDRFVAAFTTKDLKATQNGETLNSFYIESESDLLESFESKLEDEDVTKDILAYCEKIWKDYYGNNGVYNYLGEKI